MMYPCPNVSEEQYDVFTNAGPCAAFRAPGQVQGIFALEQAIDELAERLGIDPLALRDRIDTRGTRRSLARATVSAGSARRSSAGARRPANADAGPIKRGIGMAQSQWVSVVHRQTACEVRDVRATARSRPSARAGHRHGDADRARAGGGRGVRPAAPRTSARYIGDTRYPAGPPSGGSRVTGSLTPAARNAAYRCARASWPHASRPLLGASADDIVFADGRVACAGQRLDTAMPFKDAVKKAGVRRDLPSRRTPGRLRGLHDVDAAICASASTASAACSSPRCEVDTETGHRQGATRRRRARLRAAHQPQAHREPDLRRRDPGTELRALRGAPPGRRRGQQLNANVDQYKIVGSREVPEIEVHILEQLGAQSSTDARGVAEPANVATAAAIANAFYNATGKRIRTLPMTPANVLAALRATLRWTRRTADAELRVGGCDVRGAGGLAAGREPSRDSPSWRRPAASICSI